MVTKRLPTLNAVFRNTLALHTNCGALVLMLTVVDLRMCGKHVLKDFFRYSSGWLAIFSSHACLTMPLLLGELGFGSHVLLAYFAYLYMCVF